MGKGLQSVLKLYGSMVVQSGGKKVKWLWDYKNDKARIESEMTKDEIKESEKAKWTSTKQQLK